MSEMMTIKCGRNKRKEMKKFGIQDLQLYGQPFTPMTWFRR